MVENNAEGQLPYTISRLSVNIPEHPAKRISFSDANSGMTASQLEHYKSGKSTIISKDDPDAVFARNIDEQYEREVKAALISPLVELVADDSRNISPITEILRKRKEIHLREKRLLDQGIPATAISHAPDKLENIFRADTRVRETYFLYSGNGQDIPLRGLMITPQLDDTFETKSINIGLTQKEDLFPGQVEINIPVAWDGLKGQYLPDIAGSRITLSSGTLKSVRFNEAAKLMLDAANSSLTDFENTVNAVDYVFTDAEKNISHN